MPIGDPSGDAAVAATVATGQAASPASAPNRGQAWYEIRFLENGIDHHRMAAMMAQVCEEKAVHPELHDLCVPIEQAHTQEIAQMQS